MSPGSRWRACRASLAVFVRQEVLPTGFVWQSGRSPRSVTVFLDFELYWVLAGERLDVPLRWLLFFVMVLVRGAGGRFSPVLVGPEARAEK